MLGIDDVIAAGLRIVDKFLPDPQAKMAAQLELARMKQAGEFKDLDAELQKQQLQVSTNNIEAASNRLFVAGWRPFLGWICGMALLARYFVVPILAWISSIKGWPAPPELDWSDLMPLMFGMLGLGAMRTVEKVKKVA